MKLFFSSLTLLVSLSLFSQEKSKIKFGEVSAKDFETKVYPIDTTADAVIIADIGSSELEGNLKGGLSLRYKKFRRVHILNNNAFDLANVSIFLSSNGDMEEQLDKVRAITYNLENGKVVESKLDVRNGIFKDKIDRERMLKKFTLPNVKAGAIIEYEYTIISDFLSNLRPWEFQGAYPRLWSEYNLSLPEFLGYAFLTQGFKKYDILDRKERRETYRIIDGRGTGASEHIEVPANVTDYRWVIKNMQALKEESFTSSIDNHISKIEFQFSEYRYPLTYRRVMGSWDKVAQGLLEADYFGKQITKDNGWLKEVIAPLKKGGESKTEIANRIFSWVRDNMTCTDYQRRTIDQTLKNLVKTKNGTVAEINLLLIAMLRYEDIETDPVILSTRSNGYTYSLYPLLTQFNYVVARTVIDNKVYFLDASEPKMGFGHLPVRCYNGHARIINKTGDATYLITDSLNEAKFTSIFVINDEKGNWVGSMQQTPGYYESYSLRNRIKEKGKEQLQKDIVSGFGSQIAIKNFVVDSLELYDNPITLKYDFDVKDEKEDIIYLNPMFGEGQKENPFKSAERKYPVEMPYKFDESYSMQIEVPKGYVVDELPKSMIVKLNEENEGIFEYRISQSGDNISFRSRVRISRTVFQPEEYEMLREFFNLVVKKHAEQIVFKKK